MALKQKCGHSLNAVFDTGNGSPRTCAMCAIADLLSKNDSLEGELARTKAELGMWKTVVGLLKMSELIALAERSGLSVSLKIVPNDGEAVK